MSTPPTGPSGMDPVPLPPPASGFGGPWRSDQLPPHPMAGVTRADLEQPSTIRIAVRLMWAGAALTVLGLLSTVLVIDEMRELARESDPSLTPSQVDSAISEALTLGALYGLVLVGLWLWMASANGKGKGWARVVATVLGALNVFIVLASRGRETTTSINVAFSFASLALAIAILLLLYQPASSRFYQARSRVGCSQATPASRS